MMSDCQVKHERGRREVIVLSARQDHLILYLHVTTFVSDSSRLFVNLSALPKGRQERVSFYTRERERKCERERRERSEFLHERKREKV